LGGIGRARARTSNGIGAVNIYLNDTAYPHARYEGDWGYGHLFIIEFFGETSPTIEFETVHLVMNTTCIVPIDGTIWNSVHFDVTLVDTVLVMQELDRIP
jgi:hypothetical protein